MPNQFDFNKEYETIQRLNKSRLVENPHQRLYSPAETNARDDMVFDAFDYENPNAIRREFCDKMGPGSVEQLMTMSAVDFFHLLGDTPRSHRLFRAIRKRLIKTYYDQKQHIENLEKAVAVATLNPQIPVSVKKNFDHVAAVEAMLLLWISVAGVVTTVALTKDEERHPAYWIWATPFLLGPLIYIFKWVFWKVYLQHKDIEIDMLHISDKRVVTLMNLEIKHV